MEKAIYIPNTAAIPRFLTHIQSAGTPPKLSQAYLKSVGFKSGNDTYLIPVMKALGFVDASGTPTDRWKDYRDKGRASEVLGSAVAEAYRDLYQVYPDAHRKDTDALRNFFSTHYSKLSENTLGLVVRTFKVLAERASFEEHSKSDGPASRVATRGAPPMGPESPRASGAVDRGPVPDVHIDVQVHIPATATAEQIDQIFASMAKHLYGRS